MVDAQAISIVFAGVSIGIAAIYYSFNIRQQREARQATMLMQLYGQMTDREWLRQQQEIYHLFEYDSFEEFMEKYGPHTNMEGYITWMSRCNFYDGLGMLIKRGLIDASMVDDLISGPIIFFWEKRLVCEYYNNPAAFEWTEYLYNQIKPIRDRQHPELKT
jgi:hypothetical protein